MPSQKCGKGCPGALASMTTVTAGAEGGDCACALAHRPARNKRTALASTGTRETLIAVLVMKEEPGREATQSPRLELAIRLEAEPGLELHDAAGVSVRGFAELPR